MKITNYSRINLNEDFIKRFNELDKNTILKWILLVFKTHIDKSFDGLNEEVLIMIDEYLNGSNNVSDARTLAFKIHKNARKSEMKKQLYLRALAHMVSTIHVKTHALKTCDYLIKMMHAKKMENDVIISEKLRQISLIHSEI
ncbi:putative immunity protein [Acholeplasma granularum]|uniref:putative immunity protein n=1 Tax=Acholeplasma granularum TaxID=264635 RepID=UPI00046EAF1C|nr:hypothetical protein [Acholeplasma granularum]